MFSMVVGGQASGELGPSELCLLVGNVIRIQSSMLCWLVKKRGKNKDLLYSFPVIVNKLHRKKVVGRWLANHLPTTHRPSTDQLPTTYQPPTDHLPTTYWPTTDHLLTTCRLPTDHLSTTYRITTNHLPTTFLQCSLFTITFIPWVAEHIYPWVPNWPRYVMSHECVAYITTKGC